MELYGEAGNPRIKNPSGRTFDRSKGRVQNCGPIRRDHTMSIRPLLKKVCAALVVLVPLAASAQKSNSADQQKITDIEQKFVSISSFNSPEMTDALQKYLYDGTTSTIG